MLWQRERLVVLLILSYNDKEKDYIFRTSLHIETMTP